MDHGERGRAEHSVPGALAAVRSVLERLRTTVQAAVERGSAGGADERLAHRRVLERSLVEHGRELSALAPPAGAGEPVRALVERLDEALDTEAGHFRASSSSLDGLLDEMATLVDALEGAAPDALPAEMPVRQAPAAGAASRGQPGEADPVDPAGDFHTSVAKRLSLLRHLLAFEESIFEPQLDAFAPCGHSCAFVDEHFGVEAGRGLAKLEDLADLGLLQRELINRVHTCPRCQRCQINFREQCTSCHSIALKREQLVHHFRCGYTGLESEYERDFDLVCPKCRKELFQLGQDFDRPHETYICQQCHYLFEEPELQGQCLSCAALFHAAEADEVRVFRYRPTPLTIRAVELGRLTGLEVDSILYDADLQLATRDFLDFVVKRELIRLGRYTTAFSTCTVALTRAGKVFPIFGESDLGRVRKLCTLLAESLRALDLVTRLNAGRLGILMPESGTEGPSVVRERLFHLFDELGLTDDAGRPLTPVFDSVTWTDSATTFAQVKAFYDGAEGRA